MYLWRAVDHEGEVLDMLVQRRRCSTRLRLRPCSSRTYYLDWCDPCQQYYPYVPNGNLTKPDIAAAIAKRPVSAELTI